MRVHKHILPHLSFLPILIFKTRLVNAWRNSCTVLALKEESSKLSCYPTYSAIICTNSSCGTNCTAPIAASCQWSCKIASKPQHSQTCSSSTHVLCQFRTPGYSVQLTDVCISPIVVCLSWTWQNLDPHCPSASRVEEHPSLWLYQAVA